MQCGPPLIDLKAGDEVFAQVLLGLLERERTGRGKQIDVSMAHAAVSWLHTFLPMLDMGSRPRRSAATATSTVSSSRSTPTRRSDGSSTSPSAATPSGRAWSEPLFASPGPAPLRHQRGPPRRTRRSCTPPSRRSRQSTARARSRVALRRAAIPHAPITPIEEVNDLPFVRRRRALRTTTPDGRMMRLPPPAVTDAIPGGAWGRAAVRAGLRRADRRRARRGRRGSPAREIAFA